jgi:tRNA threonylcarbamoyladenosine biosynthesis protein TsaE
VTSALTLDGPAATLDLGRRVGGALAAGDVVLLEGPLGAGKTVFVRGVVEGLDSRDEVVSPTFVLVRHYSGRLPVVHADLYRLEDRRDIDRLGLLELAEPGVLVVEWAERAPELAPSATLRLRFSTAARETARTVVTLTVAPHLAPALEGQDLAGDAHRGRR